MKAKSDKPAAGSSRWVTCPACKEPALYSPANPARPFCSARCKSHDLGAWASEGYRVAAPAEPDPDDSQGPA
jgi:endogenous inhibitor of DNA gyrase (YacG/DUF329 family)